MLIPPQGQPISYDKEPIAMFTTRFTKPAARFAIAAGTVGIAALLAAGTANTQSATAFKNAGLVATVHTDATGGQQLAFTSSTSAFQVEAGDSMANGLLGNLTGSAGTPISVTVAGAATAGALTAFNPTNVTVRITGAGLVAAQDITFDALSTTTALALTDLTNKIGANASLKAAGISVD